MKRKPFRQRRPFARRRRWSWRGVRLVKVFEPVHMSGDALARLRAGDSAFVRWAEDRLNNLARSMAEPGARVSRVYFGDEP